MIDSLNLAKKKTLKGGLGMNVKRPSGNYLFFKKRARSRSFTKLTDLLNDSQDTKDDVEEVCSDMEEEEGNGFKYSPKPCSIKQNYSEVKTLFEEVLSPTVVTLMTSNSTGKVSCSFKCL